MHQDLILGLGVANSAVLEYLYHNSSKPILVHDDDNNYNFITLKQQYPKVEFSCGKIAANILDNIDRIIISPGIELSRDIVQTAIKKDIEVINEIELFARLNNKPVIAVTGTNGKSTIVTLLGEMAKCAGLNAKVVGNIGLPAISCMHNDVDLYIMEISSFQLETTYNLHPHIACISNISDDHLNRHVTLENYIRVKHKVYHNAKYAVYNGADLNTKPHQHSSITSFGSPDSMVCLSSHGGKEYISNCKEPLIAIDEIKLQGQHNIHNIMCCITLAHIYGIPQNAIITAIKNFTGLNHRCQLVANHNKITWINDSKGTNVGATQQALQGFAGSQGKIILILGGQAKNGDFTLLKQDIIDLCRIVIIMGQDANIISSTLAHTAPIVQVDSLASAVDVALVHAKPYDTVLLSPGCASFDNFKNYAHRGECFTSFVRDRIKKYA